MIRLFLTTCLAGIIFISPTQSIYSQTHEEELVGLLQRMVLLTAKLYEEGYTIVHIEVDKLKKGQTYIESRELYNSNHYKIIGMGGVGIKDLDISIYDRNSNLIAEDKLTDNMPEVDIEIYRTSQFTIKTKLYSLNSGYTDKEYFFCYLIAFKNKGGNKTFTPPPYQPPSPPSPPSKDIRIIATTNGFYGIEGGKSEYESPNVNGWCAGLSLMKIPENSGIKFMINWSFIYEQVKAKLPSYLDYGYDNYGNWKLITVPGESHKTSIYYLTIEPGLSLSIGTNPTFFVQGFWMLSGYIFENSDDPELISEAYHLHAGVVLHDVSLSVNYRRFLKETLKHDLISITLGFMR